MYNKNMMIEWSEQKNKLLLTSERAISFEIIAEKIANDELIDIIPNYNRSSQAKEMFIIEHNQYIYMVPFIEKEKTIILVTAIPSRKLNKIYNGGV